LSLPYADRAAAGRALAASLAALAGEPNLLVLGLPRGGVPVAAEVAAALGAPLDAFVVRKLGLPWQPELAMGAIATGGVRVLNADVIDAASVPGEVVEAVTRREREELDARERRYRGDRPPPKLAGATVILVDDGLATGATMIAALRWARAAGAKTVVAAVPVAPAESLDKIAAEADRVVCPYVPDPFFAVGVWYRFFPPVDEEAVAGLVAENRAELERRSRSTRPMLSIPGTDGGRR